MHEFPTGLSINGEEQIDNTILRVKLPNRNLHIEFKREDEGMMVTLKTAEQTRIIGRKVPIKNCKEILAFLTIPHKTINNTTWTKTIRKLIPKKKRR
jgi:hypothetical protein